MNQPNTQPSEVPYSEIDFSIDQETGKKYLAEGTPQWEELRDLCLSEEYRGRFPAKFYPEDISWLDLEHEQTPSWLQAWLTETKKANSSPLTPGHISGSRIAMSFSTDRAGRYYDSLTQSLFTKNSLPIHRHISAQTLELFRRQVEPYYFYYIAQIGGSPHLVIGNATTSSYNTDDYAGLEHSTVLGVDHNFYTINIGNNGYKQFQKKIVAVLQDTTLTATEKDYLTNLLTVTDRIAPNDAEIENSTLRSNQLQKLLLKVQTVTDEEVAKIEDQQIEEAKNRHSQTKQAEEANTDSITKYEVRVSDINTAFREITNYKNLETISIRLTKYTRETDFNIVLRFLQNKAKQLWPNLKTINIAVGTKPSLNKENKKQIQSLKKEQQIKVKIQKELPTPPRPSNIRKGIAGAALVALGAVAAVGATLHLKKQNIQNPFTSSKPKVTAPESPDVVDAPSTITETSINSPQEPDTTEDTEKTPDTPPPLPSKEAVEPGQTVTITIDNLEEAKTKGLLTVNKNGELIPGEGLDWGESDNPKDISIRKP